MFHAPWVISVLWPVNQASRYSKHNRGMNSNCCSGIELQNCSGGFISEPFTVWAASSSSCKKRQHNRARSGSARAAAVKTLAIECEVTRQSCRMLINACFPQVPAYFDSKQKAAIIAAGTMAGLEKVRLVRSGCLPVSSACSIAFSNLTADTQSLQLLKA